MIDSPYLYEVGQIKMIIIFLDIYLWNFHPCFCFYLRVSVAALRKFINDSIFFFLHIWLINIINIFAKDSSKFVPCWFQVCLCIIFVFCYWIEAFSSLLDFTIALFLYFLFFVLLNITLANGIFLLIIIISIIMTFVFV